MLIFLEFELHYIQTCVLSFDSVHHDYIVSHRESTHVKLISAILFFLLTKVPPSGASVEVLTARPLSPDQWSGSPDHWAESPHAELEFGPDGDIEVLTKQLEKER